MYNWRILLGGAASAAILAVGVAAPAFAQSQAGASASLSGVTQDGGGSGPSSIYCGLPDMPPAVAFPVAQALVDWCGTHPATGDGASQCTNPLPSGSAAQANSANCPPALTSPLLASSAPLANNAPMQAAGPASDLSSATSALPGLNSVSGSIPDLNTATGAVPGLGNVTGSLPAVGSLPAAGSATGTLSGLGG